MPALARTLAPTNTDRLTTAHWEFAAMVQAAGRDDARVRAGPAGLSVAALLGLEAAMKSGGDLGSLAKVTSGAAYPPRPLA